MLWDLGKGVTSGRDNGHTLQKSMEENINLSAAWGRRETLHPGRSNVQVGCQKNGARSGRTIDGVERNENGTNV